jgi:hypothetical protein
MSWLEKCKRQKAKGESQESRVRGKTPNQSHNPEDGKQKQKQKQKSHKSVKTVL